MAQQQSDRIHAGQAGGTSVLEWISGAVSLALTLAMLGFIGWQATTASQATPPVIEVRVERIVAAQDRWVVEVVAVNRSPSTAAAVEVQGELRQGEEVVARSQVTLDYVPGHSEHEGGLFFDQHPNGYELKVRALGYARP